MKINPITTTSNENFKGKIKYNATIDKGIQELMESTQNSYSIKHLDYAKKFVDNINKVLQSPEGDVLELTSEPASQKLVSYQCFEQIQDKANNASAPKMRTNLDVIVERLDGAMALYDILREQYRAELKKELDNILQTLKKEA